MSVTNTSNTIPSFHSMFGPSQPAALAAHPGWYYDLC